MAIRYDFYQSPDTMGTFRKRYHARPVHNSKVSEKRLVRDVSRQSGIPESGVIAVLSGLSATLVDHLSEGRTVKVPELGTFQISLRCPETRKPSDTRAKSIKVKSIHLRPEKELVKAVANEAKFVRTRWKVHSSEKSTLDDLTVLVRDYLAKNTFLNRRTLEALAHLTRATAIDRLHKLVEAGILQNISPNRQQPLYVLAEK